MAAHGSVANTGSARAIVYRNSHDNGYANFNKSVQGNFVGNLLHLGNGFPGDGGEISGYDLLVYNSVSSPGGDAAATVSLWDGDPLGLIDTRISDPPQVIPGTTCTFSGLVKGGTGGNGCVNIGCDGPGCDICMGGFMDGTECEDDADCGLCPALPGDDFPECPGLFRLICDFDSKVAIPSRNVWMILEWTEGCRMGWRWAFYEGPEIAAIGEENFCANTCPNAPVPCVDMAIEFVDAASQWSSIGVGTCCEDDGIVCDHSDGTYECGHATTCSDGVAETFDAWCFGAPSYFASFVASIYANTDTTATLVPVGASGPHTIIGNEIIMPSGGQSIELELMVAGWDTADGIPDNGIPAVKVWHAEVDASTYTSGLAGELTNSRPPCTVNTDCPAGDRGELCWSPGYCGGVWQDCPARGDLCLDLPACDVSDSSPRCGSAIIYNYPLPDNGQPNYAMSLRLDGSPDAKGTFEVALLQDPHFFIKDQGSVSIPLVALIPALITIELGKCCDRSGGPGNEQCLDDLTVGECDALGGFFEPGQTCDLDLDDSIECAPFCGDNEVNDPAEECDGADDSACAGPCGSDCLCGPFCGDNVVNAASEQCDGADDDRCPGECRADCTCPSEQIPAVSVWGLVVFVLLILSFARITNRRRAPSAWRRP
jgi:hypothetical protein